MPFAVRGGRSGGHTKSKDARIVAAEAGRFLRGEPLAHCANPEVGGG
ncbi:hypothetical protein [Streptomyces broussonetiae]|uniref:Uncharacterized protein n=1 Tax=Streptomyces broussonetiae TaxID=2686304 RepID=A0A6I6MU84_9ACTN|nr:hypothetical protein [Streptomyces broussonetiae]QHA02584.1 hypothetical protein GQF42_04135 [Streptomyces broussonetiae]